MNPTMSTTSLLSMLVMLFALAACGGGGGDNTPLPAPSYTVGGSVTGLSGSSFVLRNNGDDLDIAADGPFTFATTLTDGSPYNVTVARPPATLAQTCTVTAGSGAIAGSDVTDVQVNCADKRWGNAVPIDISALDADDPQIAIDATGNAIVVWSQEDATTGVDDIWANPYDAGTGLWGTATLIETNGDDAFNPQIAMDAAGNAIAAWEQDDPSAGVDDIWVNRYDAKAGKWDAAEQIEANGGTAGDPEIAMDAAGNAVAVWMQRGGTGVDNIVANRYDVAAGNWGAAEAIEKNSGDASDPEIAMNAAGNAVAVWVQRDATTNDFDIWAKRYDVKTGWGTATLIETIPNDAFDPAIAIDAAGNAVAMWQHDDGTGVDDIWANRYDAIAGQWGKVATRIDTDLGDTSSPEIAIDADGNVHAAWVQDDGTGVFADDIWANRYDAIAGQWGKAERIETNSGDADDPQIAIDAAGNAIAVWAQDSGTGVDDIWANRYDAAAGGWGKAARIETGDGDAVNPQIAIDAAGNAIAVWEQDDGTGVDDIVVNIYR